MSYQVTIDERPTYLYATVRGRRTPENLVRFMQEVSWACERTGLKAALLEMQLSGPSLSTTEIYQVICQRVPAGQKLDRIAYVEVLVGDADMPVFAETVARNRGVNVRLFQDASTAANWLAETEKRATTAADAPMIRSG